MQCYLHAIWCNHIQWLSVVPIRPKRLASKYRINFHKCHGLAQLVNPVFPNSPSLRTTSCNKPKQKPLASRTPQFCRTRTPSICDAATSCGCRLNLSKPPLKTRLWIAVSKSRANSEKKLCETNQVVWCGLCRVILKLFSVLPRFAFPQPHIPSDVVFSGFMHERGDLAGTRNLHELGTEQAHKFDLEGLLTCDICTAVRLRISVPTVVTTTSEAF